MTTVKNRALDVLRRECAARTFAPELTHMLDGEWVLASTAEEEVSPGRIKGAAGRLARGDPAIGWRKRA